MFKVLWEEEAIDDLKKIDKSLVKKIIIKVDTRLTQNPLKLGKSLTGEYKGLYRYRYGNYRIIYKIVKHEVHIIVFKVGHRSKIYKQFFQP